MALAANNDNERGEEVKTYAIPEGNGVFGVYAAFYLLKHANPKKVICVGQNPEKPPGFTLNFGKIDQIC